MPTEMKTSPITGRDAKANSTCIRDGFFGDTKRLTTHRDQHAKGDERYAHPGRQRDGAETASLKRRRQNDRQHRQDARIDQRQQASKVSQKHFQMRNETAGFALRQRATGFES